MKILFFFIVVLHNLNCYAQKKSIFFNTNFALGENVWEVGLQKQLRAPFGAEFSLIGGNFGSRNYDGKTKNIFGHTYPLVNSFYYDGKESKSYYSSSHHGIGSIFSIMFYKEYESKFQISFNIGIGAYFSKEIIRFDYIDIKNNSAVVDTSFVKNHANLIFHYRLILSNKLSKKIWVMYGINLPFYIMLTNAYKEQYPLITNSLALGFEPKMLLGFKIKI